MVYTFVTVITIMAPPSIAAADDVLIERGRYLSQAANCYACHTDIENDGEPLAGGRALESPFGTFYTPNITPDEATGIGGWSDADFVTAMTDGIAPDGHHYYPAFPYLAYRSATRDDLLAIKAWLFSQPAVNRPNHEHELKWYLGQTSLRLWKLIAMPGSEAAPEQYDGSRGAYLVDVLGHCNECHTPRNPLGMLQMDRRLQGNEEMSAPNISATQDGIGDWSAQELVDLFRYGALPDGDYVADHMGEVVDYSTSKWTDADLGSVIDYLLPGR